MKTNWILLFTILISISCQRDGFPEDENTDVESELYFPPITGSSWETISPASLEWDTTAIPGLLELLEEGETRAFIILKDGKIVLEEYWNDDLFNQEFGVNSNWYWASAGKTLTSFLVGKAQEEGYLSLDDVSSIYLGEGWTSMTSEQEEKVKVLHQLNMTSGMKDNGRMFDCTDPECLVYKADPGDRWAYHNSPYTLLDKVIENSTGQDFDDYFNEKIKDPIGMKGFWSYLDYNHVYFSNARSMARFGLMVLNNGNWEETEIISDKSFLEDATNSSQDLNPSYGYLWWLNGKSKTMYPGLQIVFNKELCANAPDDMFAAMGKNGQLINVIPSENMVVVRMGDNPDISLVPANFQNDVWEKLSEVMN